MTYKKVLATRKIDPSLLAKAGEKGIIIDEVEMITVSAYPPKTINPLVNSIINDIVVFTSKNAIAAVADAMDDAERCRSWKIYTLCGASANAVVQRLQTQPKNATAKDGEELASIIIKQEKPSRVFFFCGNLRREVLPALLIAHGFEVNEQVVYETLFNKAYANENYDGILFFSPSAVRSFFNVNKVDEKTVLFSIGQTTAAEIKKYSSNKLVVAAYPNENTMIDLVTSTANYT